MEPNIIEKQQLTYIRRFFGAYNDKNYYQLESLWQEGSVKLHLHAIEGGDQLRYNVTPDTEFCTCGSQVLYTSNKKYYGKTGWIGSALPNTLFDYTEDAEENSSLVNAGMTTQLGTFKGSYPHYASDNDKFALMVTYGSSTVKLMYEWGLDDLIKYGKVVSLPSIYLYQKDIPHSEKRFLGCTYVPNGDVGMWVLLSGTRIYYCTSKMIRRLNFESIVYNSDSANIDKFTKFREAKMKSCEYGDYVYAIVCDADGQYMWIKISKQTNSVVDYGTQVCDKLYECIDIVIQKNRNGLGTSPVFVCGAANKKMRFITMDSPEDISSLKVYETNIVSKEEPEFAGFNSGQDYISFAYNGDKSAQIQTYILKFQKETDTIDVFCTCVYQLDGSDPKINYWYDNDYLALQVVSRNYIDSTYPANYFSCKDGVHWYGNLGYIYKEDENGNRIDVTDAFKKCLVDNKTGVEGTFVGGAIKVEEDDGYYIRRFKIPDTIYPSVIIAGSTSSLVDMNFEPEDPSITKNRYVSDWYGNQYIVKPYSIDYNADISSDTQDEQNLIEMVFNVVDGSVMYSVLNLSGTTSSMKNMTYNSRHAGGTCYIENGYLCYKTKAETSNIFVDGRVYQWVAIE